MIQRQENIIVCTIKTKVNMGIPIDYQEHYEATEIKVFLSNESFMDFISGEISNTKNIVKIWVDHNSLDEADGVYNIENLVDNKSVQKLYYWCRNEKIDINRP